MSEPLVNLSGVHLRRNGKAILRDLTWRMNRGEHWAVIGANGSGKTTLLKIVGGTLFPSAGEATVLGCRFGSGDLLRLRRRIGWVGPALLSRLPPGERLRDIVASGLTATFGLVHDVASAEAGRVEAGLERVGLGGRGDAAFGVLSQGEQQRALFARSMLTRPELCVLDEACSGLDLPAREMFLAAAEGVMAEGRAGLIMVTHHIEEIPAGVTHALVLKAGTVLAAGAAAEIITSAVLSEAFDLAVAVERVNGRFRAGLTGDSPTRARR